ncbi:MAG TPA: hypothetical protein VK891_01655 [Euzebyales bacterium]|nr:hypothetical protein [Euzebyales bacterium]
MVALAVLQVITLTVVIGVLRQVLPALTAVKAADQRHAQGDAPTVTPQVGPAAGTPLPALTAWTDDGHEVTAADLSDGSVVLLFVDGACESCLRLIAALRHTDLRLGDIRLHPVVADDADTAPIAFGTGVRILRQRRGAVAAALAIDAMPSAIVLRGGVVLDGRVLASAAHLQRLIDRTVAATH